MQARAQFMQNNIMKTYLYALCIDTRSLNLFENLVKIKTLGCLLSSYSQYKRSYSAADMIRGFDAPTVTFLEARLSKLVEGKPIPLRRQTSSTILNSAIIVIIILLANIKIDFVAHFDVHFLIFSH